MNTNKSVIDVVVQGLLFISKQRGVGTTLGIENAVLIMWEEGSK